MNITKPHDRNIHEHDELHDLRIKYDALEQKYNTAQLENKEYKHLIEELHHQNDELKQEVSHFHQHHHEHNTVHKPLMEDHLCTLQDSLTETNTHIDRLSQELTDKTQTIHRLNAELADLQRQNEEFQAALTSSDQQKRVMKQSLQALRDSSAKSLHENEQLRNELHHLQQPRYKKAPSVLSVASPPDAGSLHYLHGYTKTQRFSSICMDAAGLPTKSPFFGVGYTVSKSSESMVQMVSQPKSKRTVFSFEQTELSTIDSDEREHEHEHEHEHQDEHERIDMELLFDEVAELRAKCSQLEKENEGLLRRLVPYEQVQENGLSATAVVVEEDEKLKDESNEMAPYAFIADDDSTEEELEEEVDLEVALEDDERLEMEGLFEKCQGELLQRRAIESQPDMKYDDEFGGLIEKFRILRWEFQVRHVAVAKEVERD